MENQQNKNRALLIGVALIFLVIVIFFIRSYNEKAGQEPEKSSSSDYLNLASISPIELSKKISSGEKFQIIDIRTSDEFKTEHIIDSVNLPLIPGQDLSIINIKKDQPVIIISNSGNEESIKNAYEKINQSGIRNVSILQGGIILWKSQHLPTVTWGDPESFVNQSKIIYADPEDIKDKIINGSSILVLDVREPSDYFSSHLPRAINIPLEELEKRRNELTLNKTIFIYGKTDIESFQGGVRLHDLGIINNVVIRGNIETWVEKGYPIEK